jgi:N,N'-diacetyllegionaminate synthase
LQPEELKSMVNAIRNIEKAISGNGIKEASNSEKKNLGVVRKSLHYNTDLIKGDVIQKNHLAILRPGTGISPMLYEEIIGKKLCINVFKNKIIKITDFL